MREGLQVNKKFVLVLLLIFGEFAAMAQNVSFARSKDVSIASPPYAGTFSTQYSFASGDFNGDGKLDFVVSSTSNALLMLGNGDGTFKSIDLGFIAQVTLVADVNQDKKADLILAIGAQAFLLLGNGDGTFQPTKLLPAIPLVVADFNGDGQPDLLAQGQIIDGQKCFENGSFSILPGNGDGTFRSPLQCSGETHQGDWGTRTIVVGDLNGDGKLDVVWGNVRGTDLIFVWLGNGDGTFKPPSAVQAGTNQGGKPIAMGDLNHDGKPDLVVATMDGISVLFGNGDGTFRTTGLYGGPYFLLLFDGLDRRHSRDWQWSNDIFMRDFDGDGNQDVLLDDALFRGKGDGTFESPQFLGIGSAYSISVICEDFNGDGKLDLVYLPNKRGVAQPGSNTMLSILLNNSLNGLSHTVLGYSAASGGSILTPSSIASIYGKNLAMITRAAPGPILPTLLGGISLRVRDSSDMVRLAQLILVSPTQINFVVPAETSIGPATLTIDDGSILLQEGANATIVANVEINFFTVSQTGKGVAAATALRIRPDGKQEAVAVFSCTLTGQCSATPIDVTSGLPIYLSLYGTGFGRATGKDLAVIGGRCKVGGKDATVQFSGPHSLFPGLDQLNLLIPQSLPSGEASIQCQFSRDVQIGLQSSNVVSIAIK